MAFNKHVVQMAVSSSKPYIVQFLGWLLSNKGTFTNNSSCHCQNICQSCIQVIAECINSNCLNTARKLIHNTSNGFVGEVYKNKGSNHTTSTKSLRNTFQQLFCQLMSNIKINQISNLELIKQLFNFSILEFWFYVSVIMIKSSFQKTLEY